MLENTCVIIQGNYGVLYGVLYVNKLYNKGRNRNAERLSVYSNRKIIFTQVKIMERTCVIIQGNYAGKFLNILVGVEMQRENAIISQDCNVKEDVFDYSR